VVGEDDEAKSLTTKLHDLAHDEIDITLAGLLAIRAPDRTERTVRRTATHGLNGCPHVPVVRKEIPPRGIERIPLDAASRVQRLRVSGVAVVENPRPDEIAVADHHRVRATALAGLVGKQRRVNA